MNLYLCDFHPEITWTMVSGLEEFEHSYLVIPSETPNCANHEDDEPEIIPQCSLVIWREMFAGTTSRTKMVVGFFPKLLTIVYGISSVDTYSPSIRNFTKGRLLKISTLKKKRKEKKNRNFVKRRRNVEQKLRPNFILFCAHKKMSANEK